MGALGAFVVAVILYRLTRNSQLKDAKEEAEERQDMFNLRSK